VNWLIRVGQWWEARRPMRKHDFEVMELAIGMQVQSFKEEMGKLKSSNQIPQTIAKEFALLNARLDRLELYVGLKRDPEAVRVPDSARIS